MQAKVLLLQAAICVALTPTIISQNRPATTCDIAGFSPSPRLVEVVTPKATTGFSGCSSGQDCKPAVLEPGDPILVNSVTGDWTCGYFQQKTREGLVWVRSKAVHAVKFDPNPPLDAWLGTWEHRENYIRIQASKIPDMLDLSGLAIWHGYLRDVVHTGEFAGTLAPDGNRMHVVQGDSDSCVVDLTLVGKYLVVADNYKCGGVNVRFWGAWERSKK